MEPITRRQTVQLITTVLEILMIYDYVIVYQKIVLLEKVVIYCIDLGVTQTANSNPEPDDESLGDRRFAICG
jgi:hypothetical protein